MSGRGKGEGAKRHRKVLIDSILGFTKPVIRRLARRAGVKSSFMRKLHFLEEIIRDSVTYCEHAKRKTLTAMDVVHALKRQRRTLYGFDS
uniref:Histone H4 n=1 Tax=Panagrolaimus davidi TaxID=227884 RepID=A0A914QMV3_9BILA